jgi:DnaJ-class molecular chaperone
LVVERVVAVQVKPGWKTGTILRYKETSSFPIPVTLMLEETPHKTFTRSGDDLVWTCRLSKRQAKVWSRLD